MKKLMAVLVSMSMLCSLTLPAFAASSVKDETVYILSGADGTTKKTIVSDWLTNPDGQSLLTDESSLTGIENVKGNEILENGAWQAAGQDIYYQGESDLPLPVQLQITYTLDGREISPNELAGKQGHVTIRFNYTVSQTADVSVNGQTETLAIPYAVITGVLLENEVFTNIQAENAQIVNDGDHTLVLGMALPGLQNSLKLDTESLVLPEFVQIEADAMNFSLPVTVTVATSEVFAQLDADKLDHLDALKDAMGDLTDGMQQLLDGSAQLHDGLGTLADGTNQLSDGIEALSAGLTALTAENETLIAGSTQVFNSLLATANAQLAATGNGIPTLTIENYAEILSSFISAMSEEGITQKAQEQVEQRVRTQEEQIRIAVTQAILAGAEEVSGEMQAIIDQKTEEQIQALIAQSMNSDEVQQQIAQSIALYQESSNALIALKEQLDSYNAFHTGLIAYTEGTVSAANGASQLQDGIPALTEGIAKRQSGAIALKDGLAAFNAQGVEKLDMLVNEDLETLLVRVRGLIHAAQDAQNYSGIAENTEGALRFIWRTDAIE